MRLLDPLRLRVCALFSSLPLYLNVTPSYFPSRYPIASSAIPAEVQYYCIYVRIAGMHVRMYVRSSMYGHLYVRRDMRKQPNLHTWTPTREEKQIYQVMQRSFLRRTRGRSPPDAGPPFSSPPFFFYFVLSLSCLLAAPLCTPYLK